MYIKLNKKNLNVKNVLINDVYISRKFNFLEFLIVVRYFFYFFFEFFVIIFKLNILKKKNDMENVIFLCLLVLMW